MSPSSLDGLQHHQLTMQKAPSLLRLSRTFTTKPNSQKQKTWIPPVYPRLPPTVPAFVSKPFQTYKLRNKILAGGRTILFGNTISEFKNRTRRTWRPNIIVKPLYSDILRRRIKLRMVAGVLRTIDKEGGLDGYLTGVTRGRMKELGPRGWEIRNAVVRGVREESREEDMRMLQRSILLCPELRIDSEWRDIRPFVRHTEPYAVLPEQYCKIAFTTLMERLRSGSRVRKVVRIVPKTVFLGKGYDSRFVRQMRNPRRASRTKGEKNVQ
jgi:ribosomal protein L28